MAYSLLLFGKTWRCFLHFLRNGFNYREHLQVFANHESEPKILFHG